MHTHSAMVTAVFTAATQNAHTSPMRILIAEDDRNVRRLLHELMQTLCDDIIECSDGEQAVTLCGQTAPDLVIMDIAMPHLNGLQATRQIRRRFPRIAVVIVTQYDSNMYRSDAAAAGACAYFLKDNLLDLLDYLRSLHRETHRN